ncbi:MAG: hypothetical protein IIZ88_03540 [Prevotella sp.]|nr:hypothetical protein [Prevotella sp.]
MEKSIKQFEVGKAYSMRSPGDQDCVWYYLVVNRTSKTVTLRQLDRNKKPYGVTAHFRINGQLSGFYGAEAVRPLGSYSLCPTLTAEKVIKELSIK